MKENKNTQKDIKLENDIKELKKFLLDIDCLDQLSEWTSKFNIFDVLKITKNEIRHSNMLAWLLNPNENHGFGEEVIRRFIHFAVSNGLDDDVAFDILLKDFEDFEVYRELNNIDILAVSNNSKIVLCIENKVFTGEHDDQLNRYYNTVNSNYPDFTKIFIYLTPQRGESSDVENWISMGYEDVVKIIELTKSKIPPSTEVLFIINNYIDAIRRDIMGDTNLKRICEDIYQNHKRAIDLIIENIPDKASEYSKVFVKWAKEKEKNDLLILNEDKCTKGYTRFTTKNMSQLLPDAKDNYSGWGTLNFYFYEIENYNNSYFMKFVMNAHSIPSDLKETCEKINKLYPSKTKKSNWKWKVCKKSKTIKIDIDDEIDEKEIFDNLDSMFNEIMEFEKDVLSRLK